MDDKWFKKRQKQVGVTADDIAKEMGRARSGVSHIYSGHQKMNLDWARAFASVLKVPLDEVLLRAGVSEPQEAQTITPGFSNNDVAPFVGKGGEEQHIRNRAASFGAVSKGTDVWVVNSSSLILRGILPGDHILVDAQQSEQCRAGDIVIAQVYNRHNGSAETLLRHYQPPVLVAASPNEDTQGVHVVDGNNVVIKGKVIANWRDYT